MTSRQDKTNRWQFKLRELLAFMLIVALFLGYWRERSLHNEATARLDAVLPATRVVISSPESLSRFSTGANIAVGGRLYLPMAANCSRVQLELLPAAESQPIALLHVVPKQFGHGVNEFGDTFEQPLGLEPGAYVILVRCFDGDKEIATGTAVIHTVVTGSTEDTSGRD